MRAVPATVQTATATATAYGGQALAWADAAVVWVELKRSAPSAAAEAADAPPERLERAQATARVHPALASGVRLLDGDGPPWTVTDLRSDEPVPGRCVLLLERLL